MPPGEHPRTRAEQVADWIGWHLAELLAVGVPLFLAATVAVWLIGLSALAGAVWAAAEIRAARAARPELDATPAARPQLSERPAHHPTPARPVGTEADDRPELYGDPS
ncbi:hypothetical protein Ga0074812_15726 [Parafrankia irregularis]|uniref:Uncharacterized protein n=1 Tax=Parafrankia irregularis TaxID=795642 RepID=A0A0S4QZS5_9ACTN|nr:MULTISPECIES: hypothetical protein [Parafrankia]MBE3206823.1 conjugal transfer protein TraH [Parafrankia sp. CH37]CUU61136.1 hypothetical protein Ga0074812_15726 [Parafrankia irregularis]